MNKKFRVDSYSIEAQRHIYPLYIKDGRGGYEFSSTMTFVRFKNESFFVFAAHALSKDTNNLDQIGVLDTVGEFMPLSEVEISHEICRESDLGVCHTNREFRGKNYFNLDVNESSTEFSKNFAWIGFPKKKAVQRIDRSRASSERIAEYITEGLKGFKKMNNAEFLLIGVEQFSESETEITGHFENRNVKYEHEGFKEQGYSLKGMSGGALFRGPMKLNADNPSHDDLFQFAGIGLEYRNNKLVKGASTHSVKALLEKMLKR